MMANFSLSWVLGFGATAKGGKKKNPSWDDILSCLEGVEGCKGSVTLDLVTESGVGSQSLQALSDDGRYVISLGEDDGKDYIVRSYSNEELQGVVFEILGDSWDGIFVCTSFQVVEGVF